MLRFFTIVLIILIFFLIVIFKRKYICNAINKKKFYLIKEKYNKNTVITSTTKRNNHSQNSSHNYSEFYKRTLRRKMLKLSKGSTEEKLQSLQIAEELQDKSTLPILRKGLKDMNLKIVERSADLIRKFK